MDRSRATYESRSDEELIRLVRRDAAALRVLYDRHAAAMQQWIYVQIQDRPAARELLAETWATVWVRAASFPGKAGAKWLYGLAKELVEQYLREHRVDTAARERLQMRSVEWDDGELDDVPRRLDAAMLSPGVREAFEELTFEQQRVLGLRLLGERTYEEVANELGISETNARFRVRRALQALRNIIKGTMP